VEAETEAEADVLELEEHEEGMLEPCDTVGVPLAVAAGSISLLSAMGSSAAGWLASWVGIGVIRWPDEGFEI